jgi:hypothetical protein
MILKWGEELMPLGVCGNMRLPQRYRLFFRAFDTSYQFYVRLHITPFQWEAYGEKANFNSTDLLNFFKYQPNGIKEIYLLREV